MPILQNRKWGPTGADWPQVAPGGGVTQAGTSDSGLLAHSGCCGGWWPALERCAGVRTRSRSWYREARRAHLPLRLGRFLSVHTEGKSLFDLAGCKRMLL